MSAETFKDTAFYKYFQTYYTDKRRYFAVGTFFDRERDPVTATYDSFYKIVSSHYLPPEDAIRWSPPKWDGFLPLLEYFHLVNALLARKYQEYRELVEIYDEKNKNNRKPPNSEFVNKTLNKGHLDIFITIYELSTKCDKMWKEPFTAQLNMRVLLDIAVFMATDRSIYSPNVAANIRNALQHAQVVKCDEEMNFYANYFDQSVPEVKFQQGQVMLFNLAKGSNGYILDWYVVMHNSTLISYFEKINACFFELWNEIIAFSKIPPPKPNPITKLAEQFKDNMRLK
jgi:hypothetical protein